MVHSLFMNNFTGKSQAELEDMFPEDYYLKAVQEAYPKATVTFDAESKKIECVTKRVKASFDKSGLEFEKWKPARVIVDWILSNKFPDETLSKFEDIFTNVNEALSNNTL